MTTFATKVFSKPMNLKIMIPSFIVGGFTAALVANAVSNTKPVPILTVPFESFSGQTEHVEYAPQKTDQGLIRIVKTDQVIDSTKDPIWKVELVINGGVVDQVDALIGRSYRQSANRHTSGNKSPLPVGNYRIDKQGIVKERFHDPELGKGYWIPITPLFLTGRSSLGIHEDPSWGKANGESGTSGCIGLRTPEDTQRVVNWIRKYGISSLVVQS